MSSNRVGVVGPAAEDDFATNIVEGLRDMGIQVIPLGPAVPPLPSRRATAVAHTLRREPRLGHLMEGAIVRRARENEINLVITVVSLTPHTVRALRTTGARVALWFPDHVANLGALWMFDAPYNGLFFKEPALVRRLNALLSLPVHYLPEACNPRIHRPVDSSEAADKVAVIGNLHPIRARLLERLASDGVPLAIYGPPEHAKLHPSLKAFHAGRYVRGLRKSAVFCSAAAVLNSLHPAEMEGMNCRLFEATAAGGAVVSEYRPELENLFESGREVVSFETYGQLLDALSLLLDDAGFRRRLGTAASRRAHAQYAYTERLKILLDLIQ